VGARVVHPAAEGEEQVLADALEEIVRTEASPLGIPVAGGEGQVRSVSEGAAHGLDAEAGASLMGLG